MHYSQPLACPFCQEALEEQGSVLSCANRHTFDIAKEGYVNLLRKKLPGDTREMLLARRTFLERGFYQPLSDAINGLISEQSQGQPVSLLDAGCGEGYYLGRVQSAFARQENHYLGLDLSKDAIRLAAKRYPQIDFIAANLKEPLPFKNNVFHLILNVFAPRNVTEFARTLIENGRLLIVIPAPEHLRELRESLQLLQIEEQKEQHLLAQFASHFSLERTVQVSYPLRLQSQEIVQVVMMTPNYWHLEAAKREVLAALPEIETEAAFTCLLFQRKPTSPSVNLSCQA